ncbi:unnamed protein product [Caenorhabditis angaria]|uniref:DUF19 domain-containing protein n=1 Tax=Caenorhabditis angaria TaxID=860376 RepID=A0A9P1N5W3_9PELO|nr:unnamed protein product [Caenorhabditis angaria]
MIFYFLLLLPIGFIETQSLCKTPNTVYTCYVSYLERYGYHGDGSGYLPAFQSLDYQMRTHSLPVICSDFDKLTSCLGSSSTYCISYDVFYTFTRNQQEAMYYLQNHAFFEFVCGNGKELFLQNQICIQKSLGRISLTDRMRECGQPQFITNMPEKCPEILEVTNCVHEKMRVECGEVAGTATCGAATNIERRMQFLDAACLTEMDVRCSTNLLSLMFSILFVITYYFI